MLSRALPQRQSLEKNVQLRRRLRLLPQLLLRFQLQHRLQLLHPRLQFQWLLLRPSHQLLSQLRSPVLPLFPLGYLCLLQRLQLPMYQRQRRHIRCLGMSLRLAVRLLRLSTTIRYLTAMTM